MTVNPTLLKRAARGDPGARHTLVETHGPLVYSLCRRLCPDPDDAYQDVWTKVFAALDRFRTDDPGRFGAWIATITRRHLVDRHRRRQVRGVPASIDHLPDPLPGPDHLTDTARLRDHLEAAIATLPFPQRLAVVGHDVHGTPLAELAADAGVPVGTIKSRLHRGRARLAELLREHR